MINNYEINICGSNGAAHHLHARVSDHLGIQPYLRKKGLILHRLVSFLRLSETGHAVISFRIILRVTSTEYIMNIPVLLKSTRKVD